MVEGWWTAGPWEKTTAEHLASDGYVVLVVTPDCGDRPADRDAMHAEMTGPPTRFAKAAIGSKAEVRIYPNAQHGFADPDNSWGGYDEATAREAWSATTAFLENKLER